MGWELRINGFRKKKLKKLRLSTSTIRGGNGAGWSGPGLALFGENGGEQCGTGQKKLDPPRFLGKTHPGWVCDNRASKENYFLTNPDPSHFLVKLARVRRSSPKTY